MSAKKRQKNDLIYSRKIDKPDWNPLYMGSGIGDKMLQRLHFSKFTTLHALHDNLKNGVFSVAWRFAKANA